MLNSLPMFSGSVISISNKFLGDGDADAAGTGNTSPDEFLFPRKMPQF